MSDRTTPPATDPAAGARPGPVLTAALYRFADLPDCADLRGPLQALCDAGGVKGLLLLAPEGVNGTIAGPEAGVRAVLDRLRADPRLAALVHKEHRGDRQPFHRMRVRLKKEIVTLGVPGIDAARGAGRYVKPADWNALLDDPEVVLVDVRNDYEVAIGSFPGALDPGTGSFAELPGWLDRQADRLRPGARVAMFCTGGIRCEKSTALLRARGIEDVVHLEGGILAYLEQVPAAQSRWQGECFVFDERVAVGPGLAPGTHALCRSCRRPLGAAEQASPLFVEGVSCPHCQAATTDAQKAGYAERQRQVALARARGVAHIGTPAPVHAATGGGPARPAGGAGAVPTDTAADDAGAAPASAPPAQGPGA